MNPTQEVLDRLRVISVPELELVLAAAEIDGDEFVAREVRDEIRARRRISVPFVEDDGGRAAAGFKGDAGDCVTRAIAIATEADYGVVYDVLAMMNHAITGKPRSARNGLPRRVYDAYLELAGWRWTPTMGIGTGCQVHLRPDELPDGRLIASVSKHLTAVVDGVIHDTHDPSRGGTRCVYGYWEAP